MDIHARRSPPAVRARHHKYRLPYADYGSDNGIAFPSIDLPGISLPPVGVDTETSTTPATTTTSNPAELPLHTSLITTSSSSSSSPSPTPSSYSTPVVVPTTSSTQSSATPSIASATPSASSDASNTTSNAVAKSKGIPGVAVGIIVAVILFIVIAVVFFLVRRKYISNRQKKRATWAPPPFPKQNDYSPAEKPHDNAYAVNEAAPPSSFDAYAGSAMSQTQPLAFNLNVTPPPVSYNSVSPQSTNVPSLAPGIGGASAAVGMSRAAATTPADAVIQCTFIPTLPDELSIRMGETVRVLEEYDDGWALCANAQGERGMVPLECLDQSAQGVVRQEQVDRRTSRRASSLVAARY